MRWLVGCMAVAAALAAPSVAQASNGLHPRTPVIWNDVPCVIKVDRSVDPVVELHYSIPLEDTEITGDEVANSRTHQFLAFCRDHDPQDPLPSWVAWADIDDAAMMPLGVDPAQISDDEVLDTSTKWGDCFTRVIADADRRPITFAEADMPVVWDTTGIAAGPWVVDGYTYEPALNVYWRRPGLVQVADSAAPEATPPGVTIMSIGSKELYRNEETQIEACVAAMDGSTLTLYTSTSDVEPLEWVPVMEDEPVMGEAVTVPFLPPEDVAGKTAFIRLDVTDPMGRSYSTYIDDAIIVLPADDPNSCPEESSIISNPGCADDGNGSDDSAEGDGTAGTGNGDGSGSDSGDSGVGTDPPAADDGNGGGCACRTDREREAPSALLVLLALAVLPRRRRR